MQENLMGIFIILQELVDDGGASTPSYPREDSGVIGPAGSGSTPYLVEVFLQSDGNILFAPGFGITRLEKNLWAFPNGEISHL
jgi:hypothetical protein